MDLPVETYAHSYITGITSNDLKVWRRISDDVEVKLKGWYKGYPKKRGLKPHEGYPETGYTILRWYNKHNSQHENEIFNARDILVHFICEY